MSSGSADRGSDSASSSVSTLILLAAISAVLAAGVTLGLALVIDRWDRPAIVVLPSTPSDLVVHVSGAVATPGVYPVPQDARLADVVIAAGGLRDDADESMLNMAARVGDGETIEIRAAPPLANEEVSPGEQASPSAGLVNINTATATELEQLPGIGPVLAERIIESRDTDGAFTDIASLSRVSGISDATVQEIAPLIVAGE
jgi:competence protein ComEA